MSDDREDPVPEEKPEMIVETTFSRKTDVKDSSSSSLGSIEINAGDYAVCRNCLNTVFDIMKKESDDDDSSVNNSSSSDGIMQSRSQLIENINNQRKRYLSLRKQMAIQKRRIKRLKEKKFRIKCELTKLECSFLVYKARRAQFDKLKEGFAKKFHFLFRDEEEMIDILTDLPQRIRLFEKNNELRFKEKLLSKYHQRKEKKVQPILPSITFKPAVVSSSNDDARSDSKDGKSYTDSYIQKLYTIGQRAVTRPEFSTHSNNFEFCVEEEFLKFLKEGAEKSSKESVNVNVTEGVERHKVEIEKKKIQSHSQPPICGTSASALSTETLHRALNRDTTLSLNSEEDVPTLFENTDFSNPTKKSSEVLPWSSTSVHSDFDGNLHSYPPRNHCRNSPSSHSSESSRNSAISEDEAEEYAEEESEEKLVEVDAEQKLTDVEELKEKENANVEELKLTEREIFFSNLAPKNYGSIVEDLKNTEENMWRHFFKVTPYVESMSESSERITYEFSEQFLHDDKSQLMAITHLVGLIFAQTLQVTEEIEKYQLSKFSKASSAALDRLREVEIVVRKSTAKSTSLTKNFVAESTKCKDDCDIPTSQMKGNQLVCLQASCHSNFPSPLQPQSIEETTPKQEENFKEEPSQEENFKEEPSQEEPSKKEPSKEKPKEEPKEEPSKEKPSKEESFKEEPSKAEPSKAEPSKKESFKEELSKEEEKESRKTSDDMSTKNISEPPQNKKSLFKLNDLIGSISLKEIISRASGTKVAETPLEEIKSTENEDRRKMEAEAKISSFESIKVKEPDTMAEITSLSPPKEAPNLKQMRNIANFSKKYGGVEIPYLNKASQAGAVSSSNTFFNLSSKISSIRKQNMKSPFLNRTNLDEYNRFRNLLKLPVIQSKLKVEGRLSKVSVSKKGNLELGKKSKNKASSGLARSVPSKIVPDHLKYGVFPNLRNFRADSSKPISMIANSTEKSQRVDSKQFLDMFPPALLKKYSENQRNMQMKLVRNKMKNQF